MEKAMDNLHDSLRTVSTETMQPRILRFLIWSAALALMLIAATHSPVSTASASSSSSSIAPVAQPECDPNWQAVSTAGAVNGGVLTGISVLSYSDIWAVGYYSGKGGFKTLTMHWDGVSWSLKNAPNGGTANNYLYGVEAVYANDVWAVGSYVINATSYTLILHWNGSYWAIVSSPNPGAYWNELRSVTAVSGCGCVWAVGFYNTAGEHARTLTMKWNGVQWSTVKSSNIDQQGRTYLFGVTTAGPSQNDLWAVGCFDHTTYTTVCTRPLIVKWNTFFQEWRVSPTPQPANSNFVILYGIAAVTSGELWAVGAQGAGYSGEMTLTMHYTNSTWSVVHSPNATTGETYLTAVSAVSANNVWAVGYSRTSGSPLDQTLVEHWNGSVWSIVPVLNIGTGDNKLYGIAAVSANDVWSVGYYTGLHPYEPLVEHYNPCN